MNNRAFTNVPFGAESQKIPHARIAELVTSKELVADHERDAFFFRALENQGILLNKPQIEAVRHFKGPLLTLAGAGSGKTTVLVCRAAYLIAVHRVDPGSLLLITFSKKAAEEMKERLGHMPGLTPRIADRVQVRTFHAFCLRILRSSGFDQEILSDSRHQQIVLKRIMYRMGLHDAYQPESLLSLLSSFKSQMKDVEELPEATAEEQELKRIFMEYEQWKMTNRKIDFDDILLKAYQLMLQRPEVLQSLKRRFAFISVDEFQDTNMVQYEIVKRIAEPHRNLMVVGDDDQTIYSFNGARNEFILQFDRHYPGAATVTLDINYRSICGVVGLGNEVIRHNRLRKRKTLQATKQSPAAPQYIRPVHTDDEADWIVSDIRRRVSEKSRGYGDFAVLYRTASSSRAIIEQLLLHDVPFVDYGGSDSFYDQWMIKPIIDHLRLAVNRRDFEAMEGMLQTLYIGREQGMAVIQDREAAQPKKWPLIHLLQLPQLKEFQKDKIKDRIRLIKALQELAPLDAIQRIRSDFYEQFLETNKRNKLTQHKEMLKETLDELESSAKRFTSIPLFLSYIEEVAHKQKDLNEQRLQDVGNKVSLMTIHKSKGLEFPAVYILCAAEGNMPHSSALDANQMNDAFVEAPAGQDKSEAALEEERRLAYVAITRAKEELIISSPAYYRGKKAEPSRFLLSVFAKPDSGSAGQGGPPGTKAAKEYAARRVGGDAAARAGGNPAERARGNAEVRIRTSAAAHASGNASGRIGKAASAYGSTGKAGAASSIASASKAAAGTGSAGKVAAAGSGLAGTAMHAGASPRTETVRAWICGQNGCTAWQRIVSYEETKLSSKPCPLCGAAMTKGSKSVPAAVRS